MSSSQMVRNVSIFTPTLPSNHTCGLIGCYMHKIYLTAPSVNGTTVTFRWRIDPATRLYRQTHFAMTFPPSVDISKVPDRLWWDIFFMCLHSHWLLLRPCQVHLPIRLSAGERKFWLEILRNGVDTLEANGPGQYADDLGIDFLDGDIELQRTTITGSGYGTAFSSGKDSLLQAAMLFELTERPLLVTTTSPLPPLSDHETARRRYVFNEIQARRDAVFVEVYSDFRSIFDDGFPTTQGYRISTNELTDTFIYMSSLLAVGAALGRTRLFLASEAEVQENAFINGRIIQHYHFMYSASTQRALAALLSLYGIHFGSLIWPLYSIQVQQILWARYPDLCDLQYSCWRVGQGQATCSNCEQCLRIAVTALSSGHDPRRMGIDLRKVFKFARTWTPRRHGSETAPILPQDIAGRRSDDRVIDAIRRTSLLNLTRLLAPDSWWQAMLPENILILNRFRRLKKRAKRLPVDVTSPMGVREAFFDWLDPELRDNLITLFTTYYPREPASVHADVFLRSHTLTERASTALGCERMVTVR
jgi:hypothetical protein